MVEEPRRLGILVPSADVVVEPDFQRFAPRELTYYTSRSYQKGLQTVSDATLNQIVDSADEAAASLAHANPELICFCCTSASFMRGPGWDQQLAARLSHAAGGIPTVTTSSAIIEALQALAARSVFMLTPYPEVRNQIEIEFFRASGIDVKSHARFDCRMGWEIPGIPPHKIVELATANRRAMSGLDALFLSCTNLRSMQVAQQLEAALEIPVVTSNQASLWLCLGRLGIDAREISAGHLFRVSYPGPFIRRVPKALEAE